MIKRVGGNPTVRKGEAPAESAHESDGFTVIRGARILPEGWVDYCRTPSARPDRLYGAHFRVTPGSLGTRTHEWSLRSAR